MTPSPRTVDTNSIDAKTRYEAVARAMWPGASSFWDGQAVEIEHKTVNLETVLIPV